MNKFKKVLLGALSVLTLGLFVVTGAKVEAQSFANGESGITLNAEKDKRTYTFNPSFGSTVPFSVGEKIVDIICTNNNKSNAANGFIKMGVNSEWKIPVPNNSEGTVTMETANAKKSDRWFIINGDASTALTPTSGKSYTIDADGKTTLSFNDLDISDGYLIMSIGGGDISVKKLIIELSDGLFVSTPVLEQQENTNGSSIRYIATVEGVTDVSLIKSWTVTMSINIDGKADYTATFTDLYTAVGGTNGKTAEENTVYLVASWKNIPSGLNGKIVSTNIKITLDDGNNTVLTSNTVQFTINVQ